MPATPEQRRLLNSWNATRHGWDRFQAGNRRAAERLARKPDPDDPATPGTTAQPSTSR